MTLRAAGPVPATVAWERYADLGHWKRWSPQIRSVDADGRRLRPGLSGVVHPVVGPGMRFVVDAVDEEQMSWIWTVTLPLVPLRMRLHHTVADADADADAAPAPGSRTSLHIAGPLPVIALYAPLAQWALNRLVTAPDA
jgi:hypothetical protein